RDLRAIQHVDRLVKIGIDCLKIEGRTKSHYYVARTAQLYRQAIDDAVADRDFNPALYAKLEGLANRGYTGGFYERHPEQAYQNYLDGHSANFKQRFVGEITGFDTKRGLADILAKNKFAVGDSLEIISPAGNRTIQLEHIENLQGKAMHEVPGGGYEIRIPLPNGDYDKALLARNLPAP
ncbi:MAG: U32 family peptidase C-terminal domain-containing protein, partial [Proteobacteria bacterium]|nr:U32 family peptidase C-terminal domain-containing protein [Pseudomonadota bacterium]